MLFKLFEIFLTILHIDFRSNQAIIDRSRKHKINFSCSSDEVEIDS